MNDLLSDELAETAHYLVHDLEGLLLLEFTLLEELFEVAVFAELGYYVEAVL